MTREWHEVWFYVAAALLWCCAHELTVSVCAWVCDCVLSVSSYRCVCVAWAGRVLYSWGILRLMRGPRDSFSLLKFLSNSRWYSFWSWPIRVLFFLRASSHLRDKNNKRAHSRLGAVFFLFLWVASESQSVSSPLGEVFKAEAQFVVMAKQLRVIRNVGEKDLCHL